MVASLQGIVAKTNASIYIRSSNETSDWLSQCAAQYGLRVQNISDPWELLDMFKSYISDGKYVLYTSSNDEGASFYEQSVNYATTVAGAESYLMVSADIENKAIECGLTIGKDVRKSSTEEIFNQYKDKLTTKMLVHQTPSKWQLRDYCIAAGAMCYYSDYYDGPSVKNEILAWADENAPIYGWTENEVNFVSSNSLNSKITIASDWSANLSLYSALDSKEKYIQPSVSSVEDSAEKKHYVAIVMSDGDNLQWMENGFATDSKYYGSPYRGTFPLTWTIAPSLLNLAPQILNYLYDNATDNDYFIAGPSGAGYVNVTEYNKDSLQKYAQLTNEYMSVTDMKYLNLIDNSIDANALDALSKQESVKGGIWSVGNMYIEGGGGVYWSNDKPFVTARETLWRIPGNDSVNQYYGFVERVAQRINSYKVDPTAIEGYTVVVAHAWSVGSMDYIARFVELLDEDVELVTVDKLLGLVSENVQHKDVTVLDDISPEDITDLVDISSEQYHKSQIDSLEIDENKSFDLTDMSKTDSYKWQFGNGGLQYDYADYSLQGIKLDGSDLNDVIDPLPNAWAVNKFNLLQTESLLTVKAAVSAGSDVNMRVRVLQVVNGKLISEVLTGAQYEKALDNFGWYKADSSSPIEFTFDLSSFAGKTVAISIEQDDTGDGSGEILFVSSVVIS